jgi:predicted nucleic-acid-binding protein
MKREIVDTNVLIRFLVGDNKVQQKQARVWFSEAEKGKRKLVIKLLVVAETCFVLESFYKKQKEEIAGAFEVFLSQVWLEVEERSILLSLWDWYKKGFHFVDSYLLSWGKINSCSIISFDRELVSKLNLKNN